MSPFMSITLLFRVYSAGEACGGTWQSDPLTLGGSQMPQAYIYTCMCVYIYIHIHTDLHAQIHTCIPQREREIPLLFMRVYHMTECIVTCTKTCIRVHTHLNSCISGMVHQWQSHSYFHDSMLVGRATAEENLYKNGQAVDGDAG